jgi:hypothetical protein
MSKRQSIPDMRLVQLCIPMSSLPSQQLKDGSLRTFESVKAAVNRALKGCGLSRDVVAEEVTRLTGHDVSVHQINNWAAPGKEDRPVPLHVLAALIEITGDHSLAQAALDGTGFKLLTPEEVVYYEIGVQEFEKKEQAETRKEIWARAKELRGKRRT